MYYSVTSSCIREIHIGEPTVTFSGSSSYSANHPASVEKKFASNRASRTITASSLLSDASAAASALNPDPPAPRLYRLNKSKIRSKMNAFFNLQATREFCAFYTITFPSGITDDDAYKLYNLWLTRCRKLYSLKSYIWVSERQKNGTLHFHLLTNTRMPVKEVNNFMRVSLRPYAYQYGWDIFKIDKYNGIDVDNVWFPKRRNPSQSTQRRTRDDAARHLGKYVTKYVSKNNETFSRLAWHESHDIAALFTAQNYDLSEITPLLTYFHDTKKFWKKYSGEFVSIYLHPNTYNLTPYTDLARVNETVYRALLDAG